MRSSCYIFLFRKTGTNETQNINNILPLLRFYSGLMILFLVRCQCRCRRRHVLSETCTQLLSLFNVEWGWLPRG